MYYINKDIPQEKDEKLYTFCSADCYEQRSLINIYKWKIRIDCVAICGMYATMRAYGLLYEAIIMSDLTAPRTIFMELERCFYLHLTTFINTCDDRYGMLRPRKKQT